MMGSSETIAATNDDDGAIAAAADCDLNLLVVLSALLRFRNITHASNFLHVSAPATTRALTRLRSIFQDELLVRRSRSFELTPLAESLPSKVLAFLVNVDKIFGDRVPAPERFTLFVPDHLGLLLTRSVTAFLRETSPSTMFIPLFSSSNILEQLEEGRVDLALGLIEDAPPGFYCRALPPVHSACLSRKGHSAVKDGLAYSDFNRHLSIRIGTYFSSGFHDVQDGLDALRPKGGEVITASDIHTAARLVEDTDALLVLPRPAAAFLTERYEVEIFEPVKVAPPPYQISLIWHERWNRRSLHAGVRSIIASRILEEAQ